MDPETQAVILRSMVIGAAAVARQTRIMGLAVVVVLLV
jgi:hypothetical protein